MQTADTNKHTISFSQEELIRYSRHFNLPQIGIQGQEKLKAARVLCIGAGGLGSPLLLYLAAAGVGTLGIVDDDCVDLSNLQRQIIYTKKDLNLKKADAAKDKLNQLNQEVTIITHKERLTKLNVFDIIASYDIVVDGTDNFASRYLINDACFYLKKPNVYASILQFEGQCSVFTASNGPCYRCLYAAPPPAGLVPNCAEGGVLGVLPGLIGTIQATEVMKLILNIGNPLIGRVLRLDALSMQFQELELRINPECCLCHYQQPFESLPYHEAESCAVNLSDKQLNSITVQELNAMIAKHVDFTLLDVREPHEYTICNLNGYLIPLAQLPYRLTELNKEKPLVVHCKADTRSQLAAKMLCDAGFSSVYFLKGGILAWSREIDTTLPQY